MGCRNYPGLKKFLVLLVGTRATVRRGWVLTVLKPFNQRKLWNSAQQFILGLHRPSICLDKTLCLLPWSNNFLYQMLRHLIWRPCDSSLYWPSGVSGYNKRKSEFKKRTVITLTALSQDWQCRVKGSSTMKILYHIVTMAVLREAACIWMFTGAQRCLLLFTDVSRNHSHDVTLMMHTNLLKYCPGHSHWSHWVPWVYNSRLLKMVDRKVSN